MNSAEQENMLSAMGGSHNRLENIDYALQKISKQLEEIIQLLKKRPAQESISCPFIGGVP